MEWWWERVGWRVRSEWVAWRDWVEERERREWVECVYGMTLTRSLGLLNRLK